MLHHYDGFDTSGSGLTAHLTRYASSANFSVDVNNFRSGTAACSFSSSAGNLVTKNFAATGGAVIGIAYRPVSFAADDIIQVREGTTVHMTLSVDATGKLVVKRGSTVLVTGTSTLVTNNWCYLELKTIIDDVNGSYEVRFNGAIVTELSNAGPVDTRNAGTTGQWNNIQLNAISTEQYDDWYICDTNGPRNMDFLGPVKIALLIPVTDVTEIGSNQGLIPSAGTDHGAMVDDHPPLNTDYNYSSVVGAKDTYNYTALTLTGPVIAVQTHLWAAKSDIGTRTICPVVRTGGADYDGANVTPLTSFAFYSQIWDLSPAPGNPAWVTADINAIQCGMKITG